MACLIIAGILALCFIVFIGFRFWQSEQNIKDVENSYPYNDDPDPDWDF